MVDLQRDDEVPAPLSREPLEEAFRAGDDVADRQYAVQYSRPMSRETRSDEKTRTSATSAVWDHHVAVPDTPEGFTVRTTVPGNPNGVEVMLEQWEAGSAEPPHSHPGDDMTVVVEGKMAIQFFTRTDGGLIPDGAPVVLHQGDTGYVAAGRVHDAKYLEPCKLVYVHDGVFGFTAQ